MCRYAAAVMFLLGILIPSQGLGQIQTIEFVFDTGRPMANAAQQLEEKFGWIITYEDPPFRYPPDLADVTAEVRRDGAEKPRVLVPRGVPFALLVKTPAADLAEPRVMLEKLIGAYEASGNPGGFRVVSASPVFHIIPTALRDGDGVAKAHQPILDTVISLPSGRRSLFEVVSDLVAAVSATSGSRVWVGTVPTNFMIRTQVEGGGTLVSARSLLRRILVDSGARLSWRLFYGPNDGSYALNIHPVVTRAPQQ